MGTPTLTQTPTIFKVAPPALAQFNLVAMDGVTCAIPTTPLGRTQLEVLGEYANEVEQARDAFVKCANELAQAPKYLDHVAQRDAYEEAFQVLQRAICKLWRAQQVAIKQYRVATIRGGVVFYAEA